METLSISKACRVTISEIIKKLSSKNIPLFSLNEIGALLLINNQQTLYKRVDRLSKSKILKKLVKGKYYFTLNDVNDFTMANFLYQPSYISMQSALSFHSIMTGFSYQITSICIKKPKTIEIDEKDFVYSKITPKLFWGWEKKEDFLIAKPEKALLDYVYFASKGLVSLDWEEIVVEKLDKRLLLEWVEKYNNSVIKEIKKHI